MTAAAPSGVVTVLFTDVEGSTSRWEADAEAVGHGLLLSAAVHLGDFALEIPREISAVPALYVASSPIVTIDHAPARSGIAVAGIRPSKSSNSA
jgi:hypothetical protein